MSLTNSSDKSSLVNCYVNRIIDRIIDCIIIWSNHWLHHLIESLIARKNPHTPDKRSQYFSFRVIAMAMNEVATKTDAIKRLVFPQTWAECDSQITEDTQLVQNPLQKLAYRQLLPILIILPQPSMEESCAALNRLATPGSRRPIAFAGNNDDNQRDCVQENEWRQWPLKSKWCVWDWNEIVFHMHFRAALPPPTGAIKWCDQINAIQMMRSNDAMIILRWIIQIDLIKRIIQCDQCFINMAHFWFFNSKSFKQCGNSTSNAIQTCDRDLVTIWLTQAPCMQKKFSSNTSIWFHPNFPMDFPKTTQRELELIII